MPRDGSRTRNAILEAAESLVLEQGYGGTSIDQILGRAGITKGAFFHHFASKAQLAHALLERYVERDDALLADLVRRAEDLSRDPLQQYLIAIGLLEEGLRTAGEALPGCLVGSFVYQMEILDDDTRDRITSSFDTWRRVLSAKLEAAREHRAMHFEVDAGGIVDNLLSLFEGGIILARLDRRSTLLAEQIRHHRNYVEMLFESSR